MTTFWMIVAAMILTAVALVAPVFLRVRSGRNLDSAGQNVAIARERLSELEADRKAGGLDKGKSDRDFEKTIRQR